MMPLKGKGQRAQACPAVVIHIKEPLVVVEGWKGWEDTGGFLSVMHWLRHRLLSNFRLCVLRGTRAPTHWPYWWTQLQVASVSATVCGYLPPPKRSLSVRLSLLTVLVYQACPMTRQYEGTLSPVSPVSALLFCFFIQETDISLQSVSFFLQACFSVAMLGRSCQPGSWCENWKWPA